VAAASNRSGAAPAPNGPATGEAYDVLGPPRAPAIVLLHGSSENRRMWKLQAEALAGPFRVIVPDYHGHGALAHLPFRMDDVMEYIAGLVDREAGGSAVAVGLSLGGYLTMEFATRYPEKLRGIVLMGCTAEPTGIGAALYWLATCVMSTAPLPILAGLKAGMGRLLLGREMAPLLNGSWFRGGAQGCRAVMWKSSIEKVRRYSGPILFINGSRDYPFRTRERSFLKAAPHARLELIPRGYHPCNLSDPTRVTLAIRRFAESLANSPADCVADRLDEQAP